MPFSKPSFAHFLKFVRRFTGKTIQPTLPKARLHLDEPINGPHKPSLAAAPFYAAILIILIMAAFIGGFWFYDEYVRYSSSIDTIRAKYMNLYQTRLVEEMDNVVEYIEFKKSQTDDRIEKELRDKVHIAYINAAHLYSLYKDDLTPENLKQMIVESLRPIRWDNGLGYFFIINADDGRFDLHGDRPSYEGTSLLNKKDVDGKFFTRDLIDIARKKGAGLYGYKWSKPEHQGKHYAKLSFVKYFKPFDWVIGTGMYVDDMIERTQADVLGWVEQVRYGHQGQVICFRNDGTTLVDFDANRSGRLITTVLDVENATFGAELLKQGRSPQGEGFVHYVMHSAESPQPFPKMSYVRAYKDWDWIFATNISMAEMEEAIAGEQGRYRQALFRDSIVFVFLLLATVTVVLIIAFFHTLKIRQSIDLFITFFKDAADKKIKLQAENLTHREFEILGKFANQMVDDRLQKEQLLKRNEIRLDALLQLSMMTDSSLDDQCSFALQKILEISSSQYGYIAIVSDDQEHIILQAVQGSDNQQLGKYRPGAALKITEAGLAGRTVERAKAMITNAPRTSETAGVYDGLEQQIARYLNVPIVDSGLVRIVGGVCNKKSHYSESDVRQLILVLEGLYHIMVKNRAEKEMNRLKNLLKGINDSLPSALISVDKKGCVVQWNRVAEELTAITVEQAQGRPLVEVFPRMESFLPTVMDVIEQGVDFEKRNVPYKANGTILYETITICPLLAEYAEGAVIRIDNVTEKVRIEGLMIQSEKMLSVGGLAAGMAHEINNPLAGILQNLQVIQNRLSLNLTKNRQVAEKNQVNLEDVTRYFQARGLYDMFDSIHESAKRAAELVMNMLSFSRKGDAMFSTQDLGKLMDQTILLASNDYDLKKNFDFKKVDIVKQYQDDMPLVPCEATNIQQVFLNILKNAAYALANGPDRADGPRIYIRIFKKDEVARVEIEDNGPGMDEATRKRIFEPFYTTKPVGIGTGLGLSLSFFIIHDQHNGSLEVRDGVKSGAVFSISLPLNRPEIESESVPY